MKALQILKKVSLCGVIMASLFSCSKTIINESSPLPKGNTSADSGLIAHWPLDSVTLANDVSGRHHNGISYNTTFTMDRFGKKNGAFYFNGINSFIAVNDSADLRLTNTDFTLNTWVKLDAYNASYSSAMITKRDNGPGGYVSGICGYASTGGAGYYGYMSAFSTQVINTGAWHMLSSVYTVADQKMSFYIDGVLNKVVTGIIPPNAPATVKLYIGRDDINSPTNGYFVQGALDDIRIYGRALSATEIQQLYTPADLNAGLIAYWPLDTTNGARDLSGNHHNGISSNTTLTTNRLGVAKSAFYFNGINSFIAVNDSADLRLTNTDFTLNTWVKLDAYNASYSSAMITKRDNGPGGYVSGISGYASTGGAGYYGYMSAFSTQVINTGAWHMLSSVYTVADQKMSFYIDGVLNKVATGITPPNAPATVKLYIGRDDINSPTNGYFVQGALDDIRIYGRSLTAAEVQQLFNLNN
ncbi:LamG domain-containing protein [Chitinophaga eiseniae]|uniref:LamG domain-containing protein n=1 Tax=Chitinophaga eiseniae TaxID=634771 RepID=A0A847SWP9_9BACT|nr:LamG domain-containing protein [Chitinophaga eiseniae]NLR82906.1 LamG domain-containing protein [Chitinophaga eiseniae]